MLRSSQEFDWPYLGLTLNLRLDLHEASGLEMDRLHTRQYKNS